MEVVIVILVVDLAMAAGLWIFYKALKGKSGCDCSQSCKSCENSKSDMNRSVLKTLLFIAFCEVLVAGNIADTAASAHKILIDPSKTSGVISPLLFGHNLEHTRWAMHKGLSAQMLVNRKFAGVSQIYHWTKAAKGDRNSIITRGRPDSNGVVAHWYPIGDGKDIWHRADTEIYYSGPQSQRIDVFKKGLTAGISQGGISVKAGVDYSIHFWLRAKQHTQTTARLTDSSGETVYARKTHTTSVGQWHLLSFDCKPTVDDPNAKLEIIFDGPCTVWIDSASMMPSDNFYGMRCDVVELLKQMSVPLLRWPGGNFTRNYKWKEGLLDVDRRPAIMMYNYQTLPFTDNYDFHEVGIDEFIKLCGYLKAEPSIVFNIADGVQSAVDWVQYCNGPADSKWGRIRAERGHCQPYNVKYFSVGNENYGGWMGPANFKPAEYGEVLKRFYKAVKKADSSVSVVGCGIGWSGKWTTGVASGAAGYMDMYSGHLYGPTTPGSEITPGILTHGRYPGSGFKGCLEAVRSEFDAAAKQDCKVPISMDEWNYGHEWMGSPSKHSWHVGAVEGMYVASSLNMFCRQSERLNIAMCAFFQPVNEGCIAVKPHTAFLNTGGQVFKLFKAHHGNRLLKLTRSNEKKGDSIDICASLQQGGKGLVVTLLNYNHQKSEAVELTIPALYLLENISADILSTDDLQNPDVLFKLQHRRLSATDGRRIRLEIPPYSITLIEALID